VRDRDNRSNAARSSSAKTSLDRLARLRRATPKRQVRLISLIADRRQVAEFQ
jgi:hypothetical protein